MPFRGSTMTDREVVEAFKLNLFGAPWKSINELMQDTGDSLEMDVEDVRAAMRREADYREAAAEDRGEA